MILFDVTRLLSAFKKGHVTGIDRVELRYYIYLRDNDIAYKLVAKFRKKIFLIKSNYFNAVVRNWINNDKVNKDLSCSFIKLFDAYFFEKPYLLYKIYSKFYIDSVSPKLSRYIKDYNESITYLNVSQLNIENTNLLNFFKANQVFIIYMLHDLIPINYPRFCTQKSTSVHTKRLQNTFKYVNTVICNSFYTKDALLAFAEKQNKVINFNITVNQLGTETWSDSFQHLITTKRNNMPIDDDFFMILGTIEPRKNHSLLLDVWESLYVDLGQACPILYIVGKRGWQSKEFYERLERLKVQMKGKIKEFNEVTDAQLILYLSKAQALLAPTYAEGWGMPVTEALTIGTPVICSDIEVLRESSQGVAKFVKIDDIVAWDGAIREVYKYNSEYRLSTIKFKPIKWEEHFERVDSIL